MGLSMHQKFLKPVKGHPNIFYHTGFDKFYVHVPGVGFEALSNTVRLRKLLKRGKI